MRFVNTTGYVMPVPPLGILAGPGEEIDWPGWDPVRNGPITGFRALEDEPGDGSESDDESAQDDSTPPAAQQPAPVPASLAPAALPRPAPITQPAAAPASEEK
jgi:hypothetical protein